MYNYLSTVVPDYVGETLDIVPHNTADVTGKKSQEIYQFKDKSVVVKTLSSQSYFEVSLEWENLTAAEYATLISLYHDPLKANGFERTFPWLNPSDGKRYTARFMSELPISYAITGDIGGVSMTLRIEGKYLV